MEIFLEAGVSDASYGKLMQGGLISFIPTFVPWCETVR